MLSNGMKGLKRLELEPYTAKVLRWGGRDPIPEAVRLSNTAKFLPAHVKTDKAGNITRMPELTGKPCFGIPTAYLRHGRRRASYVPRLKERKHNSRCDRCKIRKACVKVVIERVKVVAQASSEFRQLLGVWSEAEGMEAGGFDRASEKLGKGHWTRMIHLLAEVDFSNSNDEHVAAHWDERCAEAEKKERNAKAAALRSAWAKGDRLEYLTDGLDAGARERAQALEDLLQSDSVPKYLKRFPIESVERVTTVWWGREFAMLTGKKENANAIATILRAQGRSLDKSQSVLRAAVKKDLEQYIPKLEANAKYNGGTAIWPKFQHPALREPPTF